MAVFRIALLLLAAPLAAQTPDTRWSVLEDGGIVWHVGERLPHDDHIEMSGRHLSTIVRYGVGEDGRLSLSRRVIWPTLRVKVEPEPWYLAYRSYLDRTYDDLEPNVTVGGRPWAPGPVERVVLDGTLRITHRPSDGLALERVLFPTLHGRHAVEHWTLRAVAAVADLEAAWSSSVDYEDGLYGVYEVETAVLGLAPTSLAPGETAEVTLAIGAWHDGERVGLEVGDALEARRDYVEDVSEALVLRTPDPVLNEAFRLAKVRTAESLFETRMGLVHSPGGGSYYGGVWANDQVEYAGPFFPFLGYEPANRASMTAYRQFAGDMKPDYSPITSSFEVNGDLTCCNRDRGDASMYAYGATRFALASGDLEVARELWPAVAWSLEYARRQTTPDGVIASETDEMEERLPTGDANLSTTTLTYGGLRSAAALARDLGHADSAAVYSARADALRDAIENHFGATVEGYETYRYFAGNDTLRHWINLPLTVGIYDRAEGTLAALFDKLWTPDGLDVHTDAGSFWDRGTLYALRGVFNAGETALGLRYLEDYTRRRLLGEHVPYPVEAYPEGGQAHLAAESALYGRVFTEGLFGMDPTGLRSFSMTPRLPAEWPSMRIDRVMAFGAAFDLEVERVEDGLRVSVLEDGEAVYRDTAPEGATHAVAFE